MLKPESFPMRKLLAISSRIGIILLFSAIALGCEMVPPPVTVPPPSVPASQGSSCTGYNWAYGTVTPEFIQQMEEALTASGLEGSVQASTFGENDGCGNFLAMSVDYIFTVRVESLEADTNLASIGERVFEIASRFVEASPAPNLGHLSLIFQRAGQTCAWVYDSGAWNSTAPRSADEVACPAPTSEESRRLADALTLLSVDLACETSSVTANTVKGVLECERPEGTDRYLLTVTFTINGKGYDWECFHGYKAYESSSTGDTPMTVTDGSGTYYERDRGFQWTANGILFELFERIKGGPDVTLPPDTREEIYARALQAGLIAGEGSDCSSTELQEGILSTFNISAKP